MSKIWPHFDKKNPCPACGGWDWCCRAGDRAFVCMRIESPHPNKDGGFFHSYGSKKVSIPQKKWTPPESSPINPNLVSVVKDAGHLAVLSGILSVSDRSISLLDVGWSNFHKSWMFPMRNGKNELVGWNRRYPNGEKKILAGTKAGLYIPQCEPFGMTFICEGGSDCAALLDFGFFAIGRFNNVSGVDDLKEFFRIHKIYKCVIVADNDGLKKNGTRPGIDGAMRLKRELGVSSVIWMPPSPCKDVREFVKRGGTKELILSDINKKIWSKK